MTQQKFFKQPINSIKPLGWIREHLSRQVSGLTGNIDVAKYPFDTEMWAGERITGKSSNDFDITWWPYEQTSYYLDGALRVGYYLNNEKLINLAKKNIDYVKSTVLASGRYSAPLNGEWWRWPYASFNKMLMLEFELTNDTSLVTTLANHYKTFEAKDFCNDLELANLEELLWLYDKTGDTFFLTLSEEAYELFKKYPENRNRMDSDIVFGSDRIPNHHGVVYIELLKIPILLYNYTNNMSYLHDAVNGLEKMEKHFMLISGLPSTTEHFREANEIAAHETCNTATFPYTYGLFLNVLGDMSYADRIERANFNASFGAITKDFKAHQYFSAPNQVISYYDGQNFGYHKGFTTYLPGQHVECCTGNVNRFMSYYIENMWLQDEKNNIVAPLYGPSTFSTVVGENKTPITITENTNYPFSDTINFTVSINQPTTFKFILRKPHWAKNFSLKLNNKSINAIEENAAIIIEREFCNNDMLTLTFPMTLATEHISNGVGFTYGPLVFSLPVDAREERNLSYEKQNDEFPAKNRFPVSTWQYAFSQETFNQLGYKIHVSTVSGYPFDADSVNMKLEVPLHEILNWDLEKKVQEGEEVVITPHFPKDIKVNKEPNYVTLVPYGSTLLRMTVFPKI